MPRINFTIPDSSPIISYSPIGDWVDSIADTQFYANSTFHSTNVLNASLSVLFNGTSVQLYGALRPNHDEYSVTVDGGNSLLANAHTETQPGVFDSALYSAVDLPYALHDVVLTNTPSIPGGSVDLDWVVVEIGDGDATTSNTDIWLDDTAANFTYDSSWVTRQNQQLPYYFDQTFRVTQTPGAQATLTFYGNGVQLYGAVSLNHGLYSVSLDGAVPVPYNGTSVMFRPQILLYLASGLETGMHTVILDNVGTTFTDIDFAIVSQYGGSPSSAAPFSAASPTVPASSSPSASAAPDSSSRAPPVTAIIGGIVGAVLALAIAGLLICIFARRRRTGLKYGTVDKYILEDATPYPEAPPPTFQVLPQQSLPPPPQMEEVDLPPPTYGRIFPSDLQSTPIHNIAAAEGAHGLRGAEPSGHVRPPPRRKKKAANLLPPRPEPTGRPLPSSGPAPVDMRFATRKGRRPAGS